MGNGKFLRASDACADLAVQGRIPVSKRVDQLNPAHYRKMVDPKAPSR
ncbi:hypothetical protein LA345_39525 (plasmid) [Burkholderia vietnamiensis]|nr:hypothetical protein [Burkholderia vietnamiensis]